MLNTLEPSALRGDGILGRKVRYVTGDTETRADVARAVAKRMIERDRVSMIAGGSSSSAAIAVQAICQEAGHPVHGGPHALQRHHRQGRQGQRLPPLHQRLDVRRRPRARAGTGPRPRTPRLPPDRGLQLGLDAGGVAGRLHREHRLGDGRDGQDAGGGGRLQPLLRAGARFGRRHAGAEPLRSGPGRFADPRLAARPARAAGERSRLRDRGTALLPPDGTRGGGGRQGRVRVGQLVLDAAGRGQPRLRPQLRPRVRLPALAGRAHLLRAAAPLRRRLRTGRHVRALPGGRRARGVRVRRHG